MVGLVHRLAVGAALVSLACRASSGADSGTNPGDPALPPGDTRLVDLDGDEALRLCEWQSESLHAGYCLQNAIIHGRAFGDCAEQLAECMAPDAVASLILDCVDSTLDPARSCEARVADEVRCTIDLKAVYDTMPPCDQVTDEAFRRVLYRMGPASCDALQCPQE